MGANEFNEVIFL